MIIIWHTPHSADRRALWAADEKRDMCLQLDPTEGPQRVRRRMMRAPTTVHEKHLLPKAAERRKKKKNGMLVELMIFRSETCSCTFGAFLYVQLINLRGTTNLFDDLYLPIRRIAV